MPKPRKRPTSVDSRYFPGVTPMWNPSHLAEIPKKYETGVSALADWCGPDWHNQEQSRFFVLRNYLVATVERWRKYDWAECLVRIEAQKTEADNKIKAIQAYIYFEEALKQCNDQSLTDHFYDCIGEYVLGVEKAAHDDDIKDKIQNALLSFKKLASLYFPRDAQFGPLRYHGFPTKFPSKDTAIAMVLADIVTQLRTDIPGSPKSKSIWSGQPPRMSKNLPWTAIGLLINPPSDEDSDPEFNWTGLQTRVEKASKHVVQLYREPIE